MIAAGFSSWFSATLHLFFGGVAPQDTWDQDQQKTKMEADPAFWVSACLLEAACLLWFITGLRSFLDSSEGKTSRQKLALLRQRLRECWRSVLGRRLDKRTAEEQDWMRCRLTYRVWTAFIGFGVSRVLTQQLRILFGGERQSPEIDATAIVMATAGFLLQLMPTLLNPRSLDPWYIVTSLLLNLTFVRSEIDAREVYILLNGLQMIVATLAKRTWCSIFCAAVTSAQILWMSQVQGIQFLEGEQQGPILLIFLIPIILMCSLRRLLHENAVLKMDLQRRTVELGAVSSLLLVCYDAVVPADETLTLMEDSPQLSGLLLHRFGNGLAGKSLLDFCCKEDHNRILEHFESSLVKGAPVMALHVDMLDSDQNHLKVELLHARFANLSNERCFLIGVREIQYMDAGPAPLNQSSFQQLRPVEPVGFVHDLMLTFDVPTFEILSLSSSLEGLCGQMAMEKVESILDISSTQGRSAFNVNLQDLLNEITHSPRERGVENTLWFNLLGLGNVIASVVMEHDELLDTFVGTMQIHGPLELQRFQRGIAEGTAETLTEANVQQLEQPRHRPLRSLRSVSRSSRSTSERSARGSRPVTSRVRTAPSSGSYGSHGAQRCSGARAIRL